MSFAPSFDYREILMLARELAGADSSDPIGEAKYRSAVSRAYYSAYLFAQVAAGRRMHRHYDLVQWVRTKDRLMGITIANLKTRREDADYDKPIAYRVQDILQECIADAQELIDFFAPSS